MIRPLAGKMRGVRVMPDPLQILLNPFEQDGAWFGYVITQGEGEPAVFDGKDWHSILEDVSGVEWADTWSDRLAEQIEKIHANKDADASYTQLANRMMVGYI